MSRLLLTNIEPGTADDEVRALLKSTVYHPAMP